MCDQISKGPHDVVKKGPLREFASVINRRKEDKASVLGTSALATPSSFKQGILEFVQAGGHKKEGADQKKRRQGEIEGRHYDDERPSKGKVP